MDGLIVLQPYARLIAEGEKKYEFRNYKPPKDKIGVQLYLITEKKIIAEFMITGAKYNQIRHTYFWYLRVLKKYPKPKSYNYKNGQQIWVKDVVINGED